MKTATLQNGIDGLDGGKPEWPDVDRQEKLVLVETIGSVLWFVMDGFWMLNQALPAKMMVLPTVAVNLFVFRYTNRSVSQWAIVAAMNSWLCMNVCWMIGDLDKDPAAISFARLMFALGVVLLVVAVGREARNPEGLTKVLAHFRRLRV